MQSIRAWIPPRRRCRLYWECGYIEYTCGTVLVACARHGKRAGLLVRPGMSAADLRQRSFSLLALGSDIGCLEKGLASMLNPKQ